MEKLIKLLNEWLKYKEKFGPDKLTRVAGINDSGELLFELKNGCYWHVEYIISKKAEFIKRLVENNKIDIERLHKIVDYRLEIKENYLNAHDYNSNCLLMLLAISQNPISDLISYLK